ncbi:hypothetical protein HU200_033519 [Digitaria exilis]|uniref:Uncharacterized protein n=1 Tax=Digitaria exilis TaxID=1010633 RepID=A0A835END1_9POAL|nr:hypothetical protein HU200_033519 [Digitaria exilis]
MRTSPRWTHMSQPRLRVQLRRQLGQLRFGFSQEPCTKSAISPTSGIQMSRSWMRWKAHDDTLLLILVLAPKDSWIMLCDHDKVLSHLFWANSGLVPCQAFSPRSAPMSPPTLGRPLGYKIITRRL